MRGGGVGDLHRWEQPDVSLRDNIRADEPSLVENGVGAFERGVHVALRRLVGALLGGEPRAVDAIVEVGIEPPDRNPRIDPPIRSRLDPE